MPEPQCSNGGRIEGPSGGGDSIPFWLDSGYVIARHVEHYGAGFLQRLNEAYPDA